MNSARTRAYLMLLIVAIIWGVASPIIKYTLGGFSPIVFLTYRFGISTIIALISFAVFGLHLPTDKKTFWLMLFCGFLTSTVSLGLLFFGLNDTTVLDSSLISLASPLIISMAGVVFLHEKVTKREKIGMGIAVIGTILTVIEPIIQRGHEYLKFSGNLLILGYVVATVIVAVITKRLLRSGVNPLTLTNFSFIIGFISFLPFVFINSQKSLLSASFSYHLGVFYMAIISGSLAYFLSNKAQKTIEIGEQSLFAYLYPVLSLPIAVLWLGEKITSTFIVGAIIITIGVAIAEIKRSRYNNSL
jgi:drug/metabolite transporter (DMT)-like permease